MPCNIGKKLECLSNKLTPQRCIKKEDQPNDSSSQTEVKPNLDEQGKL